MSALLARASSSSSSVAVSMPCWAHALCSSRLLPAELMLCFTHWSVFWYWEDTDCYGYCKRKRTIRVGRLVILKQFKPKILRTFSHTSFYRIPSGYELHRTAIHSRMPSLRCVRCLGFVTVHTWCSMSAHQKEYYNGLHERLCSRFRVRLDGSHEMHMLRGAIIRAGQTSLL